MRVVADLETTPIEDYGRTDKLWLYGGKDLDTGEVYCFKPFESEQQKKEAIEWSAGVDLWVGHNFLDFDMVQASRHLKPGVINPNKVLDTLVVSRLIHYGMNPVKGSSSGPHSLESWGIRLGLHKGNFKDFSNYSEEMYLYWLQDLEVTEALFNRLKKYIDDSSWQKAIQCENQVQIELTRQRYYGFQFNKPEAEKLLGFIQTDMKILEDKIAQSFPPKLTLVNTLKYRKTKEGEEYATVKKAKSNYSFTQVNGEDLECYEWIPFNPGSPIARIDALWEAGWKPFEKTKTHQKFGRLKPGMPYGKSVDSMTEEFYNQKKEHLEKYGWTVNEDNLATLPDDAPEGARHLAEWLTLEGRRSSLVEWIGQVQEDGRIHGTTLHIGAWTGRGAHKEPNTANIASVWPKGKAPSSPVETVKARYDTHLRALWGVPTGSWLVGVDADGIQLRILADYLWRHFNKDDYAKAILSGKKEEGTDIHNVNRRALALEHITRDDAKTFIYAWVLNAGDPKVASILKTTVPKARDSKDNFEKSIPGLKVFKSEYLPAVADQGWFTGYDGRKVIVPNLHKTLAGILQNGEAVLMKHAMIQWHKELRGSSIKYKPCSWVHDEWQTEVIGSEEEAEYVKQVQIKSIEDQGVELGFKIPLAGSGSIGKTWADTH